MAEKVQKIVGASKQPIEIITAVPPKPLGVAFIAHGFGARLHHPTVEALHQACYAVGLVTVRWNASERRIHRISATGYYGDLEAVVLWSGHQSWYREPFVLAGHSLGAMISGHYAANHPSTTRNLVLLAPAIDELVVRSAMQSREFMRWVNRKIPSWVFTNRFFRAVIASRLERDLRKYSLMRSAPHITVPTLLIGGKMDDIARPTHIEELYTTIASPRKQLHILNNLSHDIHPYDLTEVSEVVRSYLEEYWKE